MLEQRESVRRKEQQRGAVMDWPQPPIPHPPAPLGVGGGRRVRMKERSLGKKGWGLVFSFLSSFLTIQLDFNWQ